MFVNKIKDNNIKYFIEFEDQKWIYVYYIVFTNIFFFLNIYYNLQLYFRF